MTVFRSIVIFVLAGICEIGGGYLVWMAMKQGKPIWTGIAGALILALYGVVATWQVAEFGRVYAAYGGIFIVLSVLWAITFDGFKPDARDLLGAAVALLGALIMIWPRATAGV